MYIHEIKLDSKDAFADKFNDCSEIYQKTQNPLLSKEEKDKLMDEFIAKRQCLELGIW